MNRTAILALLLLVAAGGYFWQHYGLRPQAPDFELRTPDGREVRLEDQYGRVVVLDFWASWCPPCKASIPALNRLYGKFRDRGVLVYGVQVRDDVDPVQFLERRGVDYPPLVGNDEVQRAYNVTSIPTIVVIGVDGRVVHRSVGWTDADETRLDRVLTAYLGEVGMQ